MSITALRSRSPNIRTSSPLLSVAGSGTRTTERRRSRSRSRANVIESKLAKRVDEIPMVHDTIEYLLSTYSLIKDSNPLLKESLQRGEDAAFWMSQKTREIIEATNLDRPLKQMDSMAAKTLEDVEKRTKKLRDDWEKNNKALSDKIRRMSKDLNEQSQSVQYTVFEAMQTIMDYIEESFENVMLPCTPESAKFAEDPSFKMTMSRIVDMTYRFYAGLLTLSINRLRELSDTKYWATVVKPYTDPNQIKLRAEIIGKEIGAAPGKKLSYMENKELTELDRQLITTSRALRAAAKTAVESMGRGPGVVTSIMANVLKYNQELVKQLSEAKSVNDVTGIGLHETRRALEAAKESMASLKQSELIDKTINWLAIQEQKIAK